jgi:hypothetical protein
MLMIAVFVFGIAIGFSLVIIQVVHAQTPTVISPPPNPTSGLKFLDQKAYIFTVPPLEVQQQQQGQGSNSLQEIILPILTSAGAFVMAKFSADKKHKENAAEILKGKEVNKEMAKVTYDMKTEAAAKIDDAPLVKQETLAKDVTEYGQKVAKK